VSVVSDCRQWRNWRVLNPPNRRGTDPCAGWCGRGGIARCPPIPIDSGVPAAAQSVMPSIATAAAMTADVISTSADAFDGPQLHPRIYTSLADVFADNLFGLCGRGVLLWPWPASNAG